MGLFVSDISLAVTRVETQGEVIRFIYDALFLSLSCCCVSLSGLGQYAQRCVGSGAQALQCCMPNGIDVARSL